MVYFSFRYIIKNTVCYADICYNNIYAHGGGKEKDKAVFNVYWTPLFVYVIMEKYYENMGTQRM